MLMNERRTNEVAPDPESTSALAGMRRFPTNRMTERISRESELEVPVNVIEETLTLSIRADDVEEEPTGSTGGREEGGGSEGSDSVGTVEERSTPGKS